MGTLLTRSHRLARIDTQEQAMETHARTRALGPKHHWGCACCFSDVKTAKAKKKKKKIKGKEGKTTAEPGQCGCVCTAPWWLRCKGSRID